jgi:Flp pilus assembly protein TadD
VPNRRIISLAAAFLLVAAALVPLTIRGGLTHDMFAVVWAADDAAAEQETAQTANDAGQQPKRKKGGFWRALARFFGGGQKQSKEAAKKKDANATTAAAPPVVAAAKDVRKEKVEEKIAGKGDAVVVVDAGEAPAPPSRAAARPASSPAETTRIVRPAEERLRPKPERWVPVIDGIPPDPLSQGRALLQHGYVHEAVSQLSIASSVGDNLVEANNLLGLAYDRLGWHREAIEAYERALSVKPNDAVVLANLGNSHYAAMNYGAALKRLKQAARLSPATAVIHNNLGVVQARTGKYDDAFKSFARAGGEYDAHVKLADILETVKRDREAAKHYEAALRLQPGTNALLERLVAIYERTGERTKADTARRSLGKPRNEQKTTTGGGG